MARKKASVETLGELHGIIAETLSLEIQGYKDRGEPVPASLLAQAIKFLSENNIQAKEEDPDLQNLKARTSNVLGFPFDPALAAALPRSA